MGKDFLYTNGVIAVKEKDLLREKILRFCEMKPEDAFRALTESGFGNGAETDGVQVEPLVEREEALLDAFIREYAPGDAELQYLLAPRDFHNAKALLKAQFLHADGEKMLAPEGLVPVPVLSAGIREGNYGAAGGELSSALKEAAALLEEGASGAEIGGVFERALFRHLALVCKKNRTLRNLVAYKADMTNLLTAFRSSDRGYAETMYVDGGKLKREELARVFDGDAERAERAFSGTPYAEFCRLCFEARREGKPYTQAEKTLSSCEADFFAARKFEQEGNVPFLFYVFRRRAEIANVRLVFVCLFAGMAEQDVKKRLRAV